MKYRNINEYKELQTAKDRYPFYLLNDGERDYDFKLVDKDMMYNVLFYTSIFNNLNIDCVNAIPAEYKKQRGLLSPSYNQNHAPIITLSNLFHGEYKEIIKKEDYNLIDLYKQIDKFCNGKKYADRKTLKREALIHFILQILCGNLSLNLEWLVQENHVLPVPFHNFESCGKLGNKKELLQKKYALSYRLIVSKLCQHTIEDFKSHCSKEEEKVFKMYLESMQEINTQKVIGEVEEKTNGFMPLKKQLILTRNYKQNLQNVEDIMSGKI